MYASVTELVRRFLTGSGASHTTMVVGVSGGIDSMVMLDVLHSLSSEYSLTIVVAHANHGLRGIDSDGDARFVESACEQRALAFCCDQLDVTGYNNEHGTGIEAAARELRYSFFARVAELHDAKFVAVGHTADDAAETMLINLARGSGIHGLASHAPSRPMGSHLTLLRPLLAITREQVTDYASSAGLVWREDASNASMMYLRNQVRAIVMPALREVFGSAVSQRIARSAELLRSSQQTIIKAIAAHTGMITSPNQHTVTIALAPFQSLHSAEQAEIVRYAITERFMVTPSHTDIYRVIETANGAIGHRATLAHNIVAWREREEIFLDNLPYTEQTSVVVSLNGTYVANNQSLHIRTTPAQHGTITPDLRIAYVNTSCLSGEMHWRNWNPGERFVPFGMQESVLVADVLTNARIPVHERKHTMVVADELGIVWVCGVRQSERTRIIDTTTQVTTFTLS